MLVCLSLLPVAVLFDDEGDETLRLDDNDWRQIGDDGKTIWFEDAGGALLVVNLANNDNDRSLQANFF